MNTTETTSHHTTNPKPAKKKRERKEYMKKYYHEHRQGLPCPNCGQQLACPRTLRYHEKHCKRCHIKRLEQLWISRNENQSRELDVDAALMGLLEQLFQMKPRNRSSKVESESA